jgi:hypothetical protein
MLFCIYDKLLFNIGTYIYTTNVILYLHPFIYDWNHMYEIHAMYVHVTVIDQYLFTLFIYLFIYFNPASHSCDFGYVKNIK